MGDLKVEKASHMNGPIISDTLNETGTKFFSLV